MKPQLVIEAEYRGVTHGNVLRQASFKGLREDKPAREVVREVPVAAMAQRQAVRKSARTKARPERAKAVARSQADVGNVHLSHPDRVYWPDAGVTKEDLAEYYVSVWDWMAPHVVGRPLALLRAPEGVGGETLLPEAHRRQCQKFAAASRCRLKGARRHRRGKRVTS